MSRFDSWLEAGAAEDGPEKPEVKLGGTYTEAQYLTEGGRGIIIKWLNGGRADEDVERVARYMSNTMRIGGIRPCRELVRLAIKETK